MLYCSFDSRDSPYLLMCLPSITFDRFLGINMQIHCTYPKFVALAPKKSSGPPIETPAPPSRDQILATCLLIRHIVQDKILPFHIGANKCINETERAIHKEITCNQITNDKHQLLAYTVAIFTNPQQSPKALSKTTLRTHASDSSDNDITALLAPRYISSSSHKTPDTERTSSPH